MMVTHGEGRYSPESFLTHSPLPSPCTCPFGKPSPSTYCVLCPRWKPQPEKTGMSALRMSTVQQRAVHPWKAFIRISWGVVMLSVLCNTISSGLLILSWSHSSFLKTRNASLNPYILMKTNLPSGLASLVHGLVVRSLQIMISGRRPAS